MKKIEGLYVHRVSQKYENHSRRLYFKEKVISHHFQTEKSENMLFSFVLATACKWSSRKALILTTTLVRRKGVWIAKKRDQKSCLSTRSM